MALASAERMIDYLSQRLRQHAYAVIDECKQGFTDEAKKAETLFMHLLNEAGSYAGFSFRNMNVWPNTPRLSEKPVDEQNGINYPAIDLADERNGVCVQITFQGENPQQKINHTINNFIKHQLKEQYTRVWIIYAAHNRAPKVKANSYDKNLVSIFGLQDIVDWVKYQSDCTKSDGPLTRAHDCVKYWLDGTHPPRFGTINTDEHHEKAIAYQQGLSKLPYDPLANLPRTDYCQYIEVRDFRSLCAFNSLRQQASMKPGSNFKKWSQLPDFRHLEQDIDELVAELVDNFNNHFPKGFDSVGRWSEPQSWDGFPSSHRIFKDGLELNDSELEYCRSIRNKLLQLMKLINDHKQRLASFGKTPY